MENNSEEYRTLFTCTTPRELEIVKSILDEEFYEYILDGEFLIQTNPFQTNIYDGVKVKVKQEYFERTERYLEQYGYKENPVKTPEFLMKLNHLTSKLPLLDKVSLDIRMVIILGIAFLLFMIFYYFI
ncbi:hypothetical protein [Cytophaga aurantiaca]|uniref:hypothetical protein n=1 Tax=Cytophaga aurantiaca TaxID=29530 RepID=UPI00036BA59E|nr:hypothetical protein [Cytophaga aurantiaca]